MGFLDGLFGSSQNTTTTKPQVLEGLEPLVGDLANRAKTAGSRPYAKRNFARIAPLSGTTRAGMGMTRGIATDPRYGQRMNMAEGMIGSSTDDQNMQALIASLSRDIRPERTRVGHTRAGSTQAGLTKAGLTEAGAATAGSTRAGAWTDPGAAAAYQNPHTDLVLDRLLRREDEGAAEGRAAMDRRLAGKKAFGSGSDVANAQFERDAGNRRADLVARELNKGYDKGADIFRSDTDRDLTSSTGNVERRLRADVGNIDRRLSSDTNNMERRLRSDVGNVDRGLTSDTRNVDRRLTSDTANVDRDLTSGTRNADRSLEAQRLRTQGIGAGVTGEGTRLAGRRAAGNDMGSIAERYRTGLSENARNLLGIGDIEQRDLQRDMDLQEKDFAEQRDFPENRSDFLARTVYGAPRGQTTTTPGPSMGSQILGAGIGLAGMGSGFGWFRKGGAVKLASGGEISDEEAFKALSNAEAAHLAGAPPHVVTQRLREIKQQLMLKRRGIGDMASEVMDPLVSGARAIGSAVSRIPTTFGGAPDPRQSEAMAAARSSVEVGSDPTSWPPGDTFPPMPFPSSAEGAPTFDQMPFPQPDEGLPMAPPPTLRKGPDGVYAPDGDMPLPPPGPAAFGADRAPVGGGPGSVDEETSGGGGAAETPDRYAQILERLLANDKPDKGRILMQIGAAMMSGQKPGFLANVGEGLGAGAKAMEADESRRMRGLGLAATLEERRQSNKEKGEDRKERGLDRKDRLAQRREEVEYRRQHLEAVRSQSANTAESRAREAEARLQLREAEVALRQEKEESAGYVTPRGVEEQARKAVDNRFEALTKAFVGNLTPEKKAEFQRDAEAYGESVRKQLESKLAARYRQPAPAQGAPAAAPAGNGAPAAGAAPAPKGAAPAPKGGGTGTTPPRPPSVPGGTPDNPAKWSQSRRQWRDPSGKIYDEAGRPL